MSKIVVFNDSHQADGFETAVASINECLKKQKHEIRVKTQFIEDYVSDEGEYSYHLTIHSIACPYTMSITDKNKKGKKVNVKDIKKYSENYR